MQFFSPRFVGRGLLAACLYLSALLVMIESTSHSKLKSENINVELEFPPNILKHLNDRNQDKREQAGRDLQAIVAKNLDKKNLVQIEKILNFFQDNYLRSATVANKKTGIEVFVSIVNGFKNHSEEAARLVHRMVLPIVECFNDTEQRIRYNAIKSLYYMCKELQGICMLVFNDVFEQLIGKIADFDEQVKDAASLLNNTLKTIITDSLPNNKQFDMRRFMKILTDKMKAVNPFIRVFLIDWINTIDEIPSVTLLVYLPSFLEDLLVMLSDKEKDVRSKAEQCLKNFLQDLKKEFREGKLEVILSEETLSDIITILIRVAKEKYLSYTKLVTINWFQQFFQFFKEQVVNSSKIKHRFSLKKVIIQRFDEILEPILSLLSHEEQEVRKAATLTNDLLLQIMDNIKREEPINLNKVIPLLKEMLSERKSSSTSECVLTWMKFLLENYNDKILKEINDIIQKLVEKLCEGNTKNVMAIIENVSFTEQYFDLVIDKLLSLLFTKSTELKTENIFRKFCNLLNVEKTFMSVCQQLLVYKDTRFVEQIVHVLNFILVTEGNTSVLRKKLRSLSEGTNEELFRTMFRAFCFNPVCLVCLCFLSEEYEIAYHVLQIYSLEREVGPSALLEFCKLVNLLESPNFIYLRVQMMEKSRYPFLMECIYSLLMIIPQGRIFESLKNRVDVLNHVDVMEPRPQKHYRRDLEVYLGEFQRALRLQPS